MALLCVDVCVCVGAQDDTSVSSRVSTEEHQDSGYNTSPLLVIANSHSDVSTTLTATH